MLPKFDFHPTAKSYHPHNAYWLARSSRLAYLRSGEKDPAPSSAEILRDLCSWDSGFFDVITFNNKSTQAFIANHLNFAILSFRGTDEAVDWLDNADMRSTGDVMLSDGLGGIHLGFYDAFFDVWDNLDKAGGNLTIREVLRHEAYRNKPIWITGHSLGGALATVCAFQFLHEGLPFAGVYTFGQPRTCQRQMKRLFNKQAKDRFFRFQNNNDIVPRLPHAISGYHHVGNSIHIDTKQNLKGNIGLWGEFFDQVRGMGQFVIERTKGGAFRDHMIDEYVEALEKNLKVIPKGL